MFQRLETTLDPKGMIFFDKNVGGGGGGWDRKTPSYLLAETYLREKESLKYIRPGWFSNR